MALQRCLGHDGQRCGQLVDGRRCATHKAMANKASMATRTQRRPDLHKDRPRREAAVAAWRAIHGDWCPGDPWQLHPAHLCGEANPLSADHLNPPALGGPETGPLRVLCLRANASRRQQPMPTHVPHAQ